MREGVRLRHDVAVAGASINAIAEFAAVG